MENIPESKEVKILKKKYELTKTVVRALINMEIIICLIIVSLSFFIITYYHQRNVFPSETFVLLFLVTTFSFFMLVLVCLRNIWPINVFSMAMGMLFIGMISGFVLCLKLKDVNDIIKKQL